jgi:hypothetical protein
MNYREYMLSPRWKQLRREALERDGYRCRCCDTPHRLQVHHRRYSFPLGTETVDDLTTLCGGPSGCHPAIENARARRKFDADPVTALLPREDGQRGTFEQACALFEYEAETGFLRWKIARTRRVTVGQRAGSYVSRYPLVQFNRRQELVSHIVWLINRGRWPEYCVGYADGDTQNCRIENLIDALKGELPSSRRNKPSRSASGYKGIMRHKNKWRASFWDGKAKKYLGLFPTLEAAVAERSRAIEEQRTRRIE